jgi:predicted nucleic acid-binding protein
VIVVADASVLVAELLRRRGRELLSRPDLRVVVAEHQWNETAHELDKRLAAIVRHGHLSPAQADGLLSAITELVETHVIEIIPRDFYEQVESVARRRIPRDPQDWPTVALAIVLRAPILTGDQDFLGCGCPTWTVETLLQELE